LCRRYDKGMWALGSVLSIAVSGLTRAERRLEVPQQRRKRVVVARRGCLSGDKASYHPALCRRNAVNQVEGQCGGTIATVGPDGHREP